MSVYTPLSRHFFETLVENYNIGELESAEPIKAGVTNTLYQLNTSEGAYVFTLFESLSEQALKPYVALLSYLQEQQFACSAPIQDSLGKQVNFEVDKPYIVSSFLPGHTIDVPTQAQCHQVGQTLGKLHQIGMRYPEKIENQRDVAWCFKVYEELKSDLSQSQQRLIESELKRHVRINYQHLPQGVIHADLFRDNVIFDDAQLVGCIDFYYACTGPLVYDVAIAVNDWCLSQRKQAQQLVGSFMLGYNAVRELEDIEKKLFQEVLCFATLRFWLSRLRDQLMHQSSDAVQVKDPKEYEILLNIHRSRFKF